MEIYIYRHGNTTLTTEKRYVGKTDPDLSEDGLEDLKKKVPSIETEVVFTSPLKRSVQTAEVWYPNAEIVTIDGFKEMDFGKFEGKTAEEMKDDPDYQNWVDNYGHADCPDGEPMNAFLMRVSMAFRDVIGQAKKRGIKNLVIIAHGGVIMAIMAGFCKDRRQPYGWFIEPGLGWHTKLIGGQKKPLLIHPEKMGE